VLNVRGGSLGRAAIDSYGQFPLGKDVAVGVSSYFKRRDGVGKFLLLDNPERDVGEIKEYGGRITANWDVSDRFSLLFAVDGMEAENGQSPYQIEITGLDPDSYFVPGTPIQDRPNPFIGDFPALQPNFPFDLGFPTGFGFFDLNQEANSYAIYGNIKYDLNDRLTVGGGLRYTWDEKDADALFPSFGDQRAFREAEFEELTWDVNATIALNTAVNAYAQIQKGYQTGGFPPRPFGGPAQFVSFDEQTAINYEVGLKGDVMGRLVFSLAAFWTEYDDLALPFSDTQAGGGFVTIVENAGESRSRGFELEGDLELIDGLHLRTAVGYLDAEIRSVDPGTIGIGAGDSPALTPEWTLSIAPSYRVPLANGGALQFNADYSYRAEMFGQSINNPNELMDSRELIGFSIDYHAPDGSWSLGAYGENITDEVYDVGRLQQTGFVGVVLSNDRREFGARLTKHFGAM